MSLEQDYETLNTSRDFATMNATLKSILSQTPPEHVEAAKVAIAKMLRHKHIVETKMSGTDAGAVVGVDQKYGNLAKVLAGTPGGNSSVPATLGSVGGNLLKTWIASKKTHIMALVATAGGVGLLSYLYKKFYGKAPTTSSEKPNPTDVRDKKLESFEKTLLSLQKLRALSAMGKDASVEDFQSLMGTAKKKKGSQVPTKKEEALDWDKRETSIIKSVDEASRTISSFKPNNYDIPLLTTSADSSGSFTWPSFASSMSSSEPAKKKRKPKKEKVEVSEPEESDSDISDDDLLSQTEELLADVSEPEDDDTLEIEPEIARFIPVAKRGKKVKKV